MNEKKEKSHIDKIRDKLYSPKFKPRPKNRGEIYTEEYKVSKEWTPEKPFVPKKTKSLLENTMFRNIFLFGFVFFLISIAFGAIMFFGGKNTVSADNIEINVLGNAFVSGGEELPLKVEIINRNNVALEFSDLLLEYQKGAGLSEDIQRDRFTVGTIPAGGRVEELINLVLFGQQGTTRDINITLEYRVSGSSAIFIKPELYVVNISSTPVNLVVDGPEITNTNQEISFDILTNLNTENAIEDMMVIVDYPPGFDFKNATPEPTFSNNIWSLGDLTKGSEKKITVSGVISAESGENRAFNVYVGTVDENDEQRIGTQFNSQDYIIAVEKPFLDLKFAVAGSFGTEAIANPGNEVSSIINFENNLDGKITDVEITAKFSGNAFNNAGVSSSNGFYDSNRQMIVWNKETKPDLAEIDPGERGEIKFSFLPISFTSNQVKNPEINIEVSIKARQPSLGNSFQQIDNLSKKKVKFNTNLQITGHALYNSGPIQNSGPIPAKPGNSTTYTIVWSVANTINRVNNARVRAILPLYVDWTNEVSPGTANVTYNSATREVVWDIGNLDAGVGTNSAPKQVYFQVRLNPSTSQSGSQPSLVSDPVLTGKDSFTGVDITRNTASITTRLNLDSNYNPQNDSVE